MCTNRALTDLYAFSARFIQLLNRKLAYVCITDYYKSEQNVLFCLTLIIIFMKKHFFNATFWALLSLALWTTGCSDDDGYSDVDGQIPTMTLVTDHIESGAGHRFTIEGSLADQDGIVSVNLQCADLYLNKTIDLVEIYGAPQTEYELSYSYDLKRDEIGERFTVKVTVTDAGGREVSQDVLITMDGDFENPTFTIAPGKEVTVLIKDETKFNLNFTVKDDRILDYVLIEIPGVEGFESRRIEAGGQSTLSFTEKIILPNEVKSYDVTLTAVDARGNQTVTNSTISVSEMPDFPKMYLADVATVEELNSDIFGVPMVINHTGEYQYRARYYNKAAGTEIFFLPQKTDFTPICFGLDPEDNTKLTDDPETAKPIVLDEAGVYYEIDINVKESTYSMRTYSVTEATNPMKYEYGKPCFDRWENGESFIDFYIGWGGSPQDAGNQLFAQDKNNPHLFYYPENGTWTLEAGEEMNFIISNYHPDGWWDHVEWRCDDSQNVEKFGYFSKKGDVNPNWEGTNQRWEVGEGFAAQPESAWHHSLGVEPAFHGFLHGVPHFAQIFNYFFALALLHVFPKGVSCRVTPLEDVADVRHFVDFALCLLVEMLVGESASADAEHRPGVYGAAVGAKSFEFHAVGVEFKEYIGFPHDFHFSFLRQGVDDCLVGKVAASGGGEASV